MPDRGVQAFEEDPEAGETSPGKTLGTPSPAVEEEPKQASQEPSKPSAKAPAPKAPPIAPIAAPPPRPATPAVTPPVQPAASAITAESDPEQGEVTSKPPPAGSAGAASPPATGVGKALPTPDTPREPPPAPLTAPAPSTDDEPAGTPPTQTSAPVEQEKVQTDAPTQVQLTLWLNEAERGDVSAFLQGNDVFIPRENLESAGVSGLRGREVVIDGRALLSLASVSPPLTYKIDERAIALRITAPPSMLRPQTISIRRFYGDVSKTDYQTGTSGFLNYSARTDGIEALTLVQEVGLSHDGNLAQTTLTLSTNAEAVRGLTSYIINERETLRRLTIGDAPFTTGQLGATGVMGGFTLQRTYDLDPYLVRAPTIGYSGQTVRPATLEVYINDALVRKEALMPGPFTLEGLSNQNGAGIATYVIRDVFGQEEQIQIPFYVSNSVLGKGYDEFTYSLGVLRTYEESASWGYSSSPAFVGSHRIGLQGASTAGLHGELTRDAASGGGSFTILTLLGQSEVGLAGSTRRDGPSGTGGFASHSYTARLFGAGLVASLASPNFYPATGGRASDPQVLSLSGFASATLARTISASLRSQLQRAQSGNSRFLVGLTTTKRVKNWGFSASGELSYLQDLPNWSIRLSVSHNIARFGTSASVVRSEGGTAFALSANRAVNNAGRDYGYGIQADYADRASVNSLVQYQAESMRVGARYLVRPLPDGYDHSYSLEAMGTLLAIPGSGIYPVLPSQGGYGLIRMKNLRGVRGYINGNEAGETDRKGNLVLPSLLPYYANRVTVNTGDVPMTYSLLNGEMLIAPPLRGTAIADFDAQKAKYYRGRVVIEMGGQRVVPGYGQIFIRLKNAETGSALSADGEFELVGLPPGTHKSVIDFEKGSCEVDLEIPENEETITELGEIVCRM